MHIRTLTCLFCLIGILSASNLEIKGRYVDAQQWDVDTLNVTGNVEFLLPDSLQITIRPGTVVLFHGYFSIIIGNNSIKMNGTARDSIRFTAADTTSPWAGIIYDTLLYRTRGLTYTPSAETKHDTISISYCIMERCSSRIGAVSVNEYKCKGSRPMHIAHCAFRDNLSTGLYFDKRWSPPDTSPIFITDCIFERNEKSALFSYQYDVTVRGCRFSHNQGKGVQLANHGVGGLDLWHCKSIIDSNRFEDHTIKGYAAAIYHLGYEDTSLISITNNFFSNNRGSPTIQLIEDIVEIKNNTFTDNVSNISNMFGGAIYLNGTYRTDIFTNTFTGNSIRTAGDSLLPDGSGGALYINFCRNPVTVKNNLFVNNSAARGGAIFCYASDSCTFANNTFTGNHSLLSPAIFVLGNRIENRFVNNCFFGNRTVRNDDSVVYQVYVEPKPQQVAFFNCLFERSDSLEVAPMCESCVFGDPLFTDTASGDFSCHAGSPCIDAGNTALAGFGDEAVDLSGKTRTFNGVIDIGAFEFLRPATVATGNYRETAAAKRGFAISIQGKTGAWNGGFLLNGTSVKGGLPGRNTVTGRVVVVRK